MSGGAAMVSNQTVNKVKKLYKQYLKERNPNWSSGSVSTHCSDAFYIVNNEITADFWSCFENEESMRQAGTDILYYLKEELNADHAHARTRGYEADLRRLKVFLDENYQGVKQLIEHEQKTEQAVYQEARRVFEDSLEITEAAVRLTESIGLFSEMVFRTMIETFCQMMMGETVTRRINTAVIKYFLNRIAADYGKESAARALAALRAGILHFYRQTGDQSVWLRKVCRQAAGSMDLDISFDDEMFAAVQILQKASAWIFQGNPNHYNIVEYIAEQDEIIWDVRQYKQQIRSGDRVYLWIAGSAGGLIASGIVTGDPEIKVKLEDEYSLLDENYQEYLAADIKILNRCIEAPLTRQMMLEDERLKSIPILRYSNAANYKISNEQADLIDHYFNGTYQGTLIDKAAERYKKSVWLYMPGGNGRLWELFYQEQIIGVDWDWLGDFTQYGSKEEVRAALQKDDYDTASYRNTVHAVWQFSYQMMPGDVVIVRRGSGKIIGRGIVISDYIYDTARTQYRSIRRMQWTHKGEWKYPGKMAVKTLMDITPYTDLVEKVNQLFEVEAEEELRQEYPQYSEQQFLGEVFQQEAQLRMLSELLRYKRNVILEGAPGVGKTFAAKRLAYLLMGEKDVSRVEMVQFHQSYSYEDFICGFRPAEQGFKLVYGPFYEFCKLAEKDERDCFFIIDEINRGNLSNIFGEILLLIEADKRGKSNSIRLLYSNELFYVPENVYIIGMMNTADRSLAMIDYALRRRFAFFRMEPAFDHPGFEQMAASLNSNKLLALIGVVKGLNEVIRNDPSLGGGFAIGHSYFCCRGEVTDRWLTQVVEYELMPLIREYWFDEPDQAAVWAERLRGAL